MSETEQHNVQQSVQQGAQENLSAHHTRQHSTQQHGAQSSPSVRFTNATVTRGHRVIWTDGNFSIPRGTVTAIVGTNGAGKTTLLDVELDLLHLSNGSVEVLGLPAGKANEKIGYVPQNYASDIDSNITAEQSVRLGLDGTRFGIHRMSDQQRDKITQALQLAGIENHRKLRLSEMSGGMRQRVAIAQALVSDPELLLLDEPLANLDIAGQRDLVDVLAHLAEDLGMTIQIVAHDLNVLLPILTGAIYLLDGHPHYAPIGQMMDSELLTHLYGTKVEVLKTVQGDMFVRPDPHVEPENRPIHTHTPAEAARFHSDNKPADDNARQMEVR